MQNEPDAGKNKEMLSYCYSGSTGMSTSSILETAVVTAAHFAHRRGMRSFRHSIVVLIGNFRTSAF